MPYILSLINRLVQTSLRFKKTKCTCLKLIYFHFKTPTKQMLVLFQIRSEDVQFGQDPLQHDGLTLRHLLIRQLFLLI